MAMGKSIEFYFIFATPLAFRPTLSEMETAKTDLSTKVISDFNELHVFQAINNIDHNAKYTLILKMM